VALDVVSERAVQRGLADVCRGRTAIIVPHRLATVIHANNIYCSGAGRHQGDGDSFAAGGAGAY
jgi:ABC-type transport system involved in Fe-S cluster assembly fused permease/ATPase subunit